jgi:hypothetical protein
MYELKSTSWITILTGSRPRTSHPIYILMIHAVSRADKLPRLWSLKIRLARAVCRRIIR